MLLPSLFNAAGLIVPEPSTRLFPMPSSRGAEPEPECDEPYITRAEEEVRKGTQNERERESESLRERGRDGVRVDDKAVRTARSR